MLKYTARAGFALDTGVRYRYDEQNYLVISVFDSARNKSQQNTILSWWSVKIPQ